MQNVLLSHVFFFQLYIDVLLTITEHLLFFFIFSVNVFHSVVLKINLLENIFDVFLTVHHSIDFYK